MKRYFLFAVVIFFNTNIWSQTLTQTIRGTIYDSESEYTLPGATVILFSTDSAIGVISNQNGTFEINDVPVGRHGLKITFIGYDEVIMNNILVGSAKEVVLDIRLTESLIQIQEVVIEGGPTGSEAINEMATVSARSFSMEEAQRYAASVDDPARMAQSFAGVSQSDDISNEIIVRGNSPRGLLWRINGVEIPSPNHFTDVGASGGGVSALSNNMIDHSDFFTGAFPAEYGNATSGVFDINLRKGNQHKAERVFQLGVLGTDIALEGPFAEENRGSYLINYRYSTLSLLETTGIINTGENNLFQDLSFNFFLPTKKAGNFSFFGLGGLSSSEGFAPKDTSEWEDESEGYDSRFVSNMGVVGLDHKFFFNSDTYIKTVVSINGQRISYLEDSISKENLSSHLLYEEKMINSTLRLSSLLNKKINAKSTVRTGFILGRKFYNLEAVELNSATNNYTMYLDNSGHADVYQAYGQWKYRFNEKWTINTGLHTILFQLNNKYSVEPRLGLKWNFSEGKSLSFGAGLHSRMEDLSIYLAEDYDDNGVSFQPNRNLGLTKATHFVIGYDQQLNEHLHLKTEVYYQYLFNVPVENNPTSSESAINFNAGYTTTSLVNQGIAYNTGLEITLERFFSNRFYYLFSGSIFDSKYEAMSGETFNSRFNVNYRFALLGGKEYAVGEKEKNLIGVNLRGIWSGGNRYTPIDLNASLQSGNTEIVESRRFENKTPDYLRLDLTTSYRINNAKVAHVISLQVQNLTNRLNVYGYYFDENTSKIETSYQFGLLPILKYRIEF